MNTVTRRGWNWLIVVAILVLSAYVVPYTLLSNVDAWYGSFLYWNIFALVAIVIIIAIIRKWRD